MARFIELHDAVNDGKPVLINVDWIASVTMSTDHTSVRIGVKNDRNGGGHLYSISVKESYYAVKEMIV